MRLLAARRRGLLAWGLAAAFAGVWAASLATDECGAEDALECTSLGWTLLFGWMALGATFTALVVWRVAGALRPGHRVSLHDLLLVGVLAIFWLVAFGVVPQPLDAG